MTSSLDVMRGIQDPQILHLPPGVVSLDAATEAIELAESCGLFLDESQCITLESGMGERADHKWAAFEVGDIEPRQSGKNDTCAVRELYGLFVAGDRLQIHTAHEAATVNESFLRMEELISNNSELRAQVRRFSYGNGDHAVNFKSGARLVYKTRTGGAARGFAGAELLVYDEALFLQAKHVAASLATLARGRNRSHNPQMWATSSAGFSTSTFLWAMRRRALTGTGGRLAYIEHTAEVVKVVDGRFKSNRDSIDYDDRRLWALANPAMNHPEHGISEEFIESEQRAQSADLVGWARERLGIFDPPLDDEGKEVKIQADRWEALPFVPFPESVTSLAFDVSLDGGWSSIAVGAGSLQGGAHVSVIEHRQGVGWLPGRLVELVERWKPAEVGCNGRGPAGAQVGPVQAALREAGLDVEVDQLNGTRYAQACGGFYTDVVEGRLRRPDGQGPLEVAVADAAERTLSDAWVWDVRRATVPISPLVAVTIARALLPVAEAARTFAF